MSFLFTLYWELIILKVAFLNYNNFKMLRIIATDCDDTQRLHCSATRSISKIAALVLHAVVGQEYWGKVHYNNQTISNPTQNMISLTRTGGYSNADGFGIRETVNHFFVSEAGQ